MSPDPAIAISSIGQAGGPLVVIDNFFRDPDALLSAARAAVFVPGRNLYPGVRAPLPEDYWSADRLALVAGAIERSFALNGPIDIIDSSFSIVTTPPDALSVAQRLPHCDAFAPNHIALVHYLSRDGTDGTAFYRHRSTGFEAMAERHRQIYFSQVEFELRQLGPPPAAYVAGDTPLFEQIQRVESRFNRAVLYKGQQLHSGVIRPDAPLSSDPDQGRLTVTAFLTIG